MVKMKIIFVALFMACVASALGNESQVEKAKLSIDSVSFDDSTRKLMFMDIKQCYEHKDEENKTLYGKSKDVDLGPQPLYASLHYANPRPYPCDDCIASVREKYDFVCPDSTLRSDCKSLNKCFMKYSGLRDSVNEPFVKIPKVDDNQIEVQGVLSAAAVLKAMHRHDKDLRRIYKEYLKKRPSFQGKIVLKFLIARNGEISDISVLASTSGFNEFDNEIKNSVHGYFFPKSKSGKTTVVIPLMFFEKYVYFE
jgi:TonB family protein